MRLYKPRFTDRSTGDCRETLKWYLDFRDHRQIRRRIPAERCRTEKQAEAFGRMVEALVTARQYHQRPDRELAAWLHGLPRSTLRRLAKMDLIDAEYVTAVAPLSQHVADFETWLKTTKGKHGFRRSPVYIRNTMAQIRHIAKECGFHFWSEVTRAAVESCLGKLKVASKTYNEYLAAFRMFGDWLVENGRASTSPIAGIKRVRVTKTESRRALTHEEAVALVRATVFGRTRCGMSGVERATMYLLALETGYRMNELRCLTVGCFDFDRATVNLDADYTKNHQPAEQLLKRSRAEQCRAFLDGRGADEPVFAMPGDNEVLDAFRADLKAAGIKPVDDRGVKVVFHSLRYGLATALDRSGASLKERMTILRHSTKANLTLGTYTSLELVDLRGAIERLPEFPWPPTIKQAAENEQQKREVA